MRNCIIQILNIDKNDKEEVELENDIWKYTSEESIDLFYLRSAFSLCSNDGKDEFKKVYNTIMNIMSMAIYNGKKMIGETMKKDIKIKKNIEKYTAKVNKLIMEENYNENKIEEIEIDLGELCN